MGKQKSESNLALLLERYNYPSCLEEFTEEEKKWFEENKKDIVFALHHIMTMRGFVYPSIVE